MLHFRYIPGVDAGSEPDCMGPVLMPAVDGVEVIRQATAAGRVRFVRSSWEQLPTFYNIVNALECLPVVSYGNASCTISGATSRTAVRGASYDAWTLGPAQRGALMSSHVRKVFASTSTK